jgi:predicted phosphoribosyltransferase
MRTPRPHDSAPAESCSGERAGADAPAGGDSAAHAAPAGPFRDRAEAGRSLAAALERFTSEDPVVLAMPRGGVPVAAEVARALHAPLDVTVVCKIGAPRNPEFALGAVAEGGVVIVSADSARALGLGASTVRALVARAERELAAKTRRYRGDLAPVELGGRTAILIDDGLATGRSARAAIASLRRRGAERVVLAVPVAAPQSASKLRAVADEIVCLRAPPDLWAVGVWYDDFAPIDDAAVASLLADAGARPGLSAL